MFLLPEFKSKESESVHLQEYKTNIKANVVQIYVFELNRFENLKKKIKYCYLQFLYAYEF